MTIVSTSSSGNNQHAILTEIAGGRKLKFICLPASDSAPLGWENGDPSKGIAVDSSNKNNVLFSYSEKQQANDGFSITRKQEEFLAGNMMHIQRLDQYGNQLPSDKIKHVISWKGPFNGAHLGIQADGGLDNKIYKDGEILLEVDYNVLGACTIYIAQQLHLFYCAVIEGGYAIPIPGVTNSAKLAFFYRNLDVETAQTKTILTTLNKQYTIRANIASPMNFSDDGLKSVCVSMAYFETVNAGLGEYIPIYHPHEIRFYFTINADLTISATHGDTLEDDPNIIRNSSRYETYRNPDVSMGSIGNDWLLVNGCTQTIKQHYYTTISKWFSVDFAVPTARNISFKRSELPPFQISVEANTEKNGLFWMYRKKTRDYESYANDSLKCVNIQYFKEYDVTRVCYKERFPNCSNPCGGIFVHTLKAAELKYRHDTLMYYDIERRLRYRDTTVTYFTIGGQYMLQSYGYNGEDITISDDGTQDFNTLMQSGFMTERPQDDLDTKDYYQEYGEKRQTPLRINNILLTGYSEEMFPYDAISAIYFNKDNSCAQKWLEYPSSTYGYVYSTIKNTVEGWSWGPETHKPDPPVFSSIYCDTCKKSEGVYVPCDLIGVTNYTIILNYTPSVRTFDPPIPPTVPAKTLKPSTKLNTEKRPIFVYCLPKLGFYVYIVGDLLVLQRKAGFPAYTITTPIEMQVARNDKPEFGLSFINDTGGYPGLFCGDIWKKKTDGEMGKWGGRFPVWCSYDTHDCIFFSMIIPLGNENFSSINILSNPKKPPVVTGSATYGYCSLANATGENVRFENIHLV